MVSYAAMAALSAIMAGISFIVFALFFILRNKNREKSSPFLIPGLLASALLGPAGVVVISALFHTQAFGKINKFGLDRMPSVLSGINLPLVWSFIASFLLCCFAIIFLERKKEYRKQASESAASSKPSKMPIIFIIAAILAGLCPIALYLRAQTLLVDVLTPPQPAAKIIAVPPPEEIATKISSLLTYSIAAGLPSLLVLIAVIAASLFLIANRNGGYRESHLKWLYSAAFLTLVWTAKIGLNLFAMQGTETDWASAAKQMAEERLANAIKSPQTIAQNPEGIPMVHIKGGIFTMGCTPEQGAFCDADEKPAHQVVLTDFYIGLYEVTQAQWRSVMGANSSNFTGDDYPVAQIPWDEVKEFIRRLNSRTGKKYRLPTEAEWEYAARGGAQSKGYKFSGSNASKEVANISGKSQPVACRAPNELGLYDMSGNVWEWCGDRYGKYEDKPQKDPRGPEAGANRVIRGGYWNGGESFTRVSARVNVGAGVRDMEIGFRLALSLD